MKLYKAIKNNDEGVFKSPKITGDLFGYKKINEYFVDNSGFRQVGEMALTIEQFLNKVKQGYYYGITSIGQFQVYIGEFVKDNRTKKDKLADLGYISRKKIANNTYELITATYERVIRLHNTDILTFTGDKVVLNSGGYRTVTTKRRLNRYLPDNIKVYQKNGIWLVIKIKQNKIIEKLNFIDNIEIKL